MNKRLVVVIVAVIVIIAALQLWPQNAPNPTSATIELPEGFVVPTLTAEQKLGQRNYADNCLICHGDFGLGTSNGPPFMHRVYETNHHGDGAFFNAAINGVRAHHWKFGAMTPVEGMSEAQIGPIVAYIRALQKANKIF